MTVFIEAVTDPFLDNRREAAQNHRADFLTGADVRRPTRGFQLKPESFAIIRVALPDGSFLPVIDAAGEHIVEAEGRAYTTYYSNFFVSTVHDQRSEKQQITDTFGDWFIFFYGSSPNILQVSGVLLNTADFQWRAEFWENYELYLKGTRLAEMGARVYLIYDDRLVEGYILGADATDDTNKPHVIPFSFQMIVTGHTSISLVGNPNFPTIDSVYARTGSYDVGREWKANDRNFDAQAFQQANADQGGVGTGRLLNDHLREGALSTPDPATSDFLSRSQAATGGIDALSFAPSPFGMLRDNDDEFVAKGLSPVTPRDNPFGADLPSAGSSWQDQSNTIDNSVTDSVSPDQRGNTLDTTDREYMDTMGRPGHAAEETAQSGRRRGNTTPSFAESSGLGPARNTPFGMTSSGGTL